MASTAPSKIFFNYLAKKSIRDLQRKKRKNSRLPHHRGAGARSRQWALIKKVMGPQKRSRGRRGGRVKGKKGGIRRGGKRVVKRGARKRRRRRRGGRATAGKLQGARRRRRRVKPKMQGARKRRVRRGGAKRSVSRKKGGKRRRGRRKGNLQAFVSTRNVGGAPHQQITGSLRASYPNPNALRSLSSNAFSAVQKTGLQRMSPLEIYKQRL